MINNPTHEECHANLIESGRKLVAAIRDYGEIEKTRINLTGSEVLVMRQQKIREIGHELGRVAVYLKIMEMYAKTAEQLAEPSIDGRLIGLPAGSEKPTES